MRSPFVSMDIMRGFPQSGLCGCLLADHQAIEWGPSSVQHNRLNGLSCLQHLGALAFPDSEKRYRRQALQFRGIGQLLHWRALLATVLWR